MGDGSGLMVSAASGGGVERLLAEDRRHPDMRTDGREGLIRVSQSETSRKATIIISVVAMRVGIATNRCIPPSTAHN